MKFIIATTTAAAAALKSTTIYFKSATLLISSNKTPFYATDTIKMRTKSVEERKLGIPHQGRLKIGRKDNSQTTLTHTSLSCRVHGPWKPKQKKQLKSSTINAKHTIIICTKLQNILKLGQC